MCRSTSSNSSPEASRNSPCHSSSNKNMNILTTQTTAKQSSRSADAGVHKRRMQHKKKGISKVHFTSKNMVSIRKIPSRDEFMMDKESLWHAEPSYNAVFGPQQQPQPQSATTSGSSASSLIGKTEREELNELINLMAVASQEQQQQVLLRGKAVDVRSWVHSSDDEQEQEQEDDYESIIGRHNLIAEAVDSILDVQVHQWATTGSIDPEELAAVSRNYSIECQKRAQERALAIHMALSR